MQTAEMMHTSQHWEAKAMDAEAMARAMAHSPDSFAMLEIARLYRLRSDETRTSKVRDANSANGSTTAPEHLNPLRV